MQICSAYAAVCDFDIDIGLLPCLWLEVAPGHLAFNGLLIVAEPALELVFLRTAGHGDVARIFRVVKPMEICGSRD